jgi:hypothetical protein
MNGTPNESVPLESTTPSESLTMVQQASSSQNKRDDYKRRLLGKRRWLTTLDPVDTCFMDYMKQQTQPKTPDPGEEFLHSLLPDVKSMTAKQKRIFKIGVMKLIDEILDDTGSDEQSSMGLTETSTVYPTTSRLSSLQEVQDNSQSLLTYWEIE